MTTDLFDVLPGAILTPLRRCSGNRTAKFTAGSFGLSETRRLPGFDDGNVRPNIAQGHGLTTHVLLDRGPDGSRRMLRSITQSTSARGRAAVAGLNSGTKDPAWEREVRDRSLERSARFPQNLGCGDTRFDRRAVRMTRLLRHWAHPPARSTREFSAPFEFCEENWKVGIKHERVRR